jgi:hypothetical protein
MAKHLADFRQGDTVRIKIQYPGGTNLTGYKHWLTLRTSFDAATAALAVETAFGNHTADADNVAYLEATPAQTALLAPGKYVYDVQAKAPNGDIVTLLPPIEDYGDKIAVRPQVTTDAT